MEDKHAIADHKAYPTVGVLGIGLWLGALVGSFLRYRSAHREGGE